MHRFLTAETDVSQRMSLKTPIIPPQRVSLISGGAFPPRSVSQRNTTVRVLVPLFTRVIDPLKHPSRQASKRESFKKVKKVSHSRRKRDSAQSSVSGLLRRREDSAQSSLVSPTGKREERLCAESSRSSLRGAERHCPVYHPSLPSCRPASLYCRPASL